MKNADAMGERMGRIGQMETDFLLEYKDSKQKNQKKSVFPLKNADAMGERIGRIETDFFDFFA